MSRRVSNVYLRFKLMNRNWGKISPDETERRTQETREHLKFVCKLYTVHAACGRDYLHEHPDGAASWEEPCVRRIKAETHAQTLVVDRRAYKLTTSSPDGDD